MASWTSDERKWITSFEKLIKKKPNAIKAYCVSGGLWVCQTGTLATQLQQNVGLSCDATEVLTDSHDDTWGFGNVEEKEAMK